MTFPEPCVELFRGVIVQDLGPVEGEVGARREVLSSPQCRFVECLKTDSGAVFGLWPVGVVVAFGKLLGDLAFDHSRV